MKYAGDSEVITCPKCNTETWLNYDSSDCVVSASRCKCKKKKQKVKDLDKAFDVLDRLLKMKRG